MEAHSKNTGFGGLSRRRCLAIWNSAAWKASKGGKSENSLAWEAVTAGKSENSLAWEAPTGGKSENSLAWGAPTGGKSENSLAWGAPTGGKVKILSLGSPHGGEPLSRTEINLRCGRPPHAKRGEYSCWEPPKTACVSSACRMCILWSPFLGKDSLPKCAS